MPFISFFFKDCWNRDKQWNRKYNIIVTVMKIFFSHFGHSLFRRLIEPTHEFHTALQAFKTFCYLRNSNCDWDLNGKQSATRAATECSIWTSYCVTCSQSIAISIQRIENFFLYCKSQFCEQNTKTATRQKSNRPKYLLVEKQFRCS